MAPLETLKPRAIPPEASMAALPIQRKFVSGAYVPCWNTDSVPPDGRSSYQRTPVDDPAVTLWLATIASWSPKLRYARRYISRSPSESSCCVVPDWGMHVPPLHACEKAATGSVVGPVRAEFAGVAQ